MMVFQFVLWADEAQDRLIARDGDLVSQECIHEHALVDYRALRVYT